MLKLTLWSDSLPTTVPRTVRTAASIVERAVRAFIVVFVPVLMLQLNTNAIDLSTLRIAALAGLSAMIDVLLSIAGIVLPGTNPGTPSLLPRKLDTATPGNVIEGEIVPAGHDGAVAELGTGQGYAQGGQLSPGVSLTNPGPQPVVTPAAPVAVPNAGRDLPPGGSTWGASATSTTHQDIVGDYPAPYGVADLPGTNVRLVAPGVPASDAGSSSAGDVSLQDFMRNAVEVVNRRPEGDPVTSPELAPRGYGWLPQPPDPRDLKLATESLPGRYQGAQTDLSDQFPDSPYDQGQLGSCVANGTAAAVDFARLKQGLAPLRPPARLFIYYYGRQIEGTISQDSGLFVRDAFKVIGKQGAPPESDYPYDITRFTSKPSAQADADAALDVAIQYLAVSKGQVYDVIASGYPVVVGFNVPSEFEGPAIARTGIMPLASWMSGKQVGGHCVVIVSTPQMVTDAAGSSYEAVKVRNSWGTAWGLGGHFWMPTQFLMGSNASDFWMVKTMSGTGPQPQPPQPAGDFAAELAKFPGATEKLAAKAARHRVAAGTPAWTPAQYAAWAVAKDVGAR